MNNTYCVYIHLNKINNKSYIGITCQNPLIRWQGGRHYKTCPHFNRAIQKYGWNNFEHFIFQDNLTQQKANDIERLLIKLFNTNDYNYGYNIKESGTSGHHSEETKEKIRQKAIGRKFSIETRKLISEKSRGENNSRAKTVKCLNNGMIFNTAKEAGEWCNRNYSSICKCCNGKQKTCGKDPITGEKLKWKYIS